jgi:hypothetical protein
MYARVAVASNSLDLGTLPPPVANALHNTLIEMLLAHGRLVFASQDEALEFVRAIKTTGGIPPGARTRWTAALAQLKQSGRVVFTNPPGPATLANVTTLNGVRTQWGSQADVAVIADSACVLLGVPADTGILSDPTLNPDLAIPAAAPDAPAVARLHLLQQHPVAAHGSTRKKFWETVLQPIATDAHTATVLDGYLFNQLSKICHGNIAEPLGGEQVVWLLSRLDQVMSQGATVRLIANASRLQPGDTAEVIAQAIRDRWTPKKDGRPARVEVLLRTAGKGEKFPHARHIRFSTGGAIRIDGGFDRLSEASIWDQSGMLWSYDWHLAALGSLRTEERMAEDFRGQTASVPIIRP